ncbi:hypothetical protein DPMN_123542 [Dreissena polymorpha]|uniref:CCHC-type domain-containing protein n=1 Tax=Dreissena polymorpha TaxID=45954 RepID=A0A9D4GUM8_DREPO|nr:hypothetical protein DPMN_123542 [Dreissena polymorpha]
MADRIFREEQILFGIRKAAKEDVADILRRLGTIVTVNEVMRKLESTCGNVETKKTILRKFYNCSQQPTESIASFSSKLEDLYDKAVSMGGIKKDDNILKGELYQGLKKELRQQAAYKFETEDDYDVFKIYLRKMESEDREEKSETTKPSKPAVHTSTPEMNEVMSQLKKLNERIDRLKREKVTGQSDNLYIPFISRGARRGQQDHGRGFRPEQRGFREGTRRGPSRPMSSTTFMPTCYHCKQRGHIARKCPN